MITWSEQALDDREALYEFLYDFNPMVADKTDDLIERKAEVLIAHPELGVEREGVNARLLIIADISITLAYVVEVVKGDLIIRILRVLHQKQKFPS